MTLTLLSEARIIRPLKAQITKERMSNYLKKKTGKDYRIVFSPDDKGYIIVTKNQTELTKVSNILAEWGYEMENQKEPFYIDIEKNLKAYFN